MTSSWGRKNDNLFYSVVLGYLPWWVWVSREKQAKSCDYEEFEGQDLGYADIQVVARNPKEVRSTRR